MRTTVRKPVPYPRARHLEITPNCSRSQAHKLHQFEHRGLLVEILTMSTLDASILSILTVLGDALGPGLRVRLVIDHHPDDHVLFGRPALSLFEGRILEELKRADVVITAHYIGEYLLKWAENPTAPHPTWTLQLRQPDMSILLHDCAWENAPFLYKALCLAYDWHRVSAANTPIEFFINECVFRIQSVLHRMCICGNAKTE
jgi:hypothetical protein